MKRCSAPARSLNIISNFAGRDRLRGFFYIPASNAWAESVALLHMPITMHHDVIAESRVAQLTGSAYWHLRVKLMAYAGGFLLDPTELGDPPAPHERDD